MNTDIQTMNSQELLELFGAKTIKGLFTNFLAADTTNELAKTHIQYMLNVLREEQYPTEKVGRYSYHEVRNRNLVAKLKPSYILPDYPDFGGFSNITSMLSIKDRFDSNNMNKKSPFKYLESGEQFANVIKCIYAQLENVIDEPLVELQENLISYLAQYFHESKLLVNSFHYSRVFTLLNGRIDEAIQLIANSAPIKDIAESVAFIDSSAGWGCRLSAALSIHVFLLQLIVESGNYSEDDIAEFGNHVIYVGFDTNQSLLSTYRRVVSLFEELYGINPNICKFHMMDFTCEAAGNKLREYPHIKIALTSSPTLLEVYPGYSKTLNKHGISQISGGRYNCKNWKDWVDGFLIEGIYMQLFRYSNVTTVYNVIDNCKIPNGNKTELIPLTDRLVDMLKALTSICSKVDNVYFTWSDISPFKNCRDCKANGAIECGTCSNCLGGYNGCSVRKNACNKCGLTAILRTVVCVTFAR